MVEKRNQDPITRKAPKRGGERAVRGRETVQDLVDLLRGDPRWAVRFDHWHTLAPRAAQHAPFPARIDARIRELYAARGIVEPYAHQARFIEAALAREDVLVATPTASGKTLCYTVPILQSLLETQGAARALFLFPTKALSQDQSSTLTSIVEELGQDWHAFTYDGDTPPSVRRTLRDRGHLVLTNPWMLHAGILPNHAKWSELFRDLRYIVIDEVHTLSGVFGSNVANVLRRLVRIARHYGSDPRFLLCSATLRDGAEHARRLIGRDVTVIEEDGSPSGARTFGVYNPPMLNPVAGLRANALEEARELARAVCGPSHQTIFFCRRRTHVEVLTRYLKEAASNLGLSPDEIRGYRGGYLPLLRREIETGLREGRVKVVVSTNALELGIDIGALDVAVLVGYPGSQASFWQRAGRVGRRAKPSLVVQVATSDPIDQYLARHPESLFGTPKERLGLDPNNLVILCEQVKCAAFELPFRENVATKLLDDPAYGDVEHAPHVLDYLAEESRFLHKRDSTWWWMADAYPAADVTLGGTDPDNVLILDVETKKAIAEIDRAGSIQAVHEGAIYQVEGEIWKVERFDYENRRAYVRAVESDYFTEAEVDVAVRVLRLEERARRTRGSAPVARPFTNATPTRPSATEPRPDGEDLSVWRGEVHVTTLATQYKKVRFYTRENVGAEDIHLPPEELDTEAFVLTISDATALDLGLVGGDRGAAWRGVGTLIRRVAPIFLRCQPSDLGLSAHVRSPHFRRPTLILYDAVQGGVGLAEILFGCWRALAAAALDVVAHCPCAGGCPGCVGPVEEVGPLGKETARHVLEHLTAGPDPLEFDVADEESTPAPAAELPV
ncbi:MAG: DEAD/DEAH box helicase [Planctomycetes bacterium]|nr:DEAD/DEAH box helicase [Planctomycetota bacterium]